MRSTLEKTLTKEGWLPEPEEPAKPAFNRRVLTSAAEAREARRLAEAQAQEAEDRRAAARAEMLTEQGPRASIQARQITTADWLKWSSIAVLGVIVAIPTLVYVGRSLQTTELLTKEGQSGAVMTCKRGVTEAADDSTAWTWLVGGSRFRCTEWDTIEARKHRAADLTEAQYRARERAKRRSASPDTDLE